MGLFEDIGRKVGKISHEAKEATRDQAHAQCADCETLVYSDTDTCPECGSEDLLSREPSDDDAGADGESRIDEADPKSRTDDVADDESRTDEADDESRTDDGADAE